MTTHGHVTKTHPDSNGGSKLAPRTPEPSPQADGTSEPLHQRDKSATQSRLDRPDTSAEAGDKHIGATEDQVSDTSAPAGEAYSDEPRQG
jgi:hypothetical protein